MHISSLDTNYRGISLVDGEYSSGSKVLCQHCANPHCSDFAASLCRDFIPVIKFKPPIRGFSDKFNTFRLGNAWSKRVFVGSVVGLANSKTKEIFGYARVTQVETGNKTEMAELHGQFNHNIKALQIIDNITEIMLKRLKNSSGSMVYNGTDRATVIYMEMIEHEKEKDLDTGRDS